MKTSKKLSFFETLSLRLRANFDAKSSAFSESNTQSKQGVHGSTSKPSTQLVNISPFMLNEMHKFNSYRDSLFKYKWCFFYFFDEYFIPKRKFLPFYAAIEYLDTQINDIELEKKLYENQNQTDNHALDKECEIKSPDGKAREIIALYEMKKINVSKGYDDKKARCDRRIAKLECEKKRLFGKMRVHMRIVFSHQYLRLSTYYKWAKNYNSDLPVTCIDEESITSLCGSTLLGLYEPYYKVKN